MAVPLVHAEVGVEAVGDGVPRHLPTHSCLQALDVLLGSARAERERGVACIQMGQMGDLIGAQGAATARMIGPAEHPRLEEGAIKDQLPAALEEVGQAGLTLWPDKLVLFFDGHPRHSPAFGGERIPQAGQGLLFYQKRLARGFPLLLRHNRGMVRRDTAWLVFRPVTLNGCHLISPLLSEVDRDDSPGKLFSTCRHTPPGFLPWILLRRPWRLCLRCMLGTFCLSFDS